MALDPEILSVLESRFGYDRFLPKQEEVITNVLGLRDSLVHDAHGTGGGRPACGPCEDEVKFEGERPLLTPPC